MHVKRSILGMTGVTCLLTAGLAALPAQAAVPVHTASAAPTIEPAVTVTHVKPGGIDVCKRGTLCAAVPDPTRSDWKVFHMSRCTTYKVYQWNGKGSYLDNQTGGVTTFFYGKNGNVVDSFTPDAKQHPYDWSPVWKIKNC